MKPLVESFDEKFLSTLLPFFHLAFKYHSYKVKGMDSVPRTGPAILVVNHSFATYDGVLLGGSIYLQTGRSPCGLGDRQLFRFPGIKELCRKLRIVEGNPSNAERLLKENELVMLAPGGMREALRSTLSESFQVRWQNRLGFARLAVKTQVPVILAACPSADKIYDIYPNLFTKLIYKKFKLPFVFLKGLGPSTIPKPVKLTHYLSSPLIPPVVHHPADFESEVKSFHHRIMQEMERLMELENEETCLRRIAP